VLDVIYAITWEAFDPQRSVNVIQLILFLIFLFLIVFGQNLQGWIASRQVQSAMRRVQVWRDHGIYLIHKLLDPCAPETITSQEINEIIMDMLEFFVISPSEGKSTVFSKLRIIVHERERHLKLLLSQFIKDIPAKTLSSVLSLMMLTGELHTIFKKIQHNLILSKKIHSHLFYLQTSADLAQLMSNAKAYAVGLDSFLEIQLIGDSISPLALEAFIEEEAKENKDSVTSWSEIYHGMIVKEIRFEKRRCICIHARGPYSNVGQPGEAFVEIIDKLKRENCHPVALITVDAYQRLEGEPSGNVAQGIGVAVGDSLNFELNKHQIEDICLNAEPPILVESIICRESLEEAITPMTEEIKGSIPKIIRLIKKIIRTQVPQNETVIIFGIGNGIGVESKFG
jgi:hypothetical protein